ncbi:MAG: aminopeptidase [Defluviitaleaceae bacterium]|nr:aminopeptidase [Defluviitaleaceae bacterium]
MDKLQKYVKLIVNVGVNVQLGQKLLINCPVDLAYFGRLAMQEAYDAGAADVLILWNDEISGRIHYLSAPDEAFGKEVEWIKARVKHLVDEGYCLLNVYATDPEILKGVDPVRIQKQQKVGQMMSKPLSDQVTASAIQWNLASVPTPSWARKVFPNAANDEEAIGLMWDAIYAACRVDDNSDPVENWTKHVNYLQEKANKLMELNFKSLHFTNSLGTDLVTELPEGHIWMACGEKAKTGNNYIANIPTEEVFTAPHREGVNGIVYSTKPLVYMGDVIDEFWVKFEKGKVVDYGAKKNPHLLKSLLELHKNADYLGEVALVPYNSPISQSGILWYNTLYDENASCHLAFGRGYSYTLGGTDGKTEDEMEAMGLNQSLTHEDFMVGSKCLSIVGTTNDGKEVSVFVNGDWAI